MRLPERPKEITPDEGDILTSPEVYYCDGELSPAEADRYFRQRVSQIVAQRRASLARAGVPQHGASVRQPQPPRKCSGRTETGELCARDAKRGYLYCWQHLQAAERQQRRSRYRR